MKIRPVGYGPSRLSFGLRGSTAMARVFRAPPKKGEAGAGAAADDDDDDDEPNAAELKKAADKLAKSVAAEKALRAELKKFQDAEAAATAAAEEAAKEAAKKAGDFEKIEAGYKKTIADLESKVNDITGKFNDSIVNSALNAELDAAKVTNPVFRKAAMTLIKQGNKFDIGDDGAVTIGTTPLTDFVKTWSGTEEGKSFIQNGNGGGGAPPKPGQQQDGNTAKPNLIGNPAERAAAIAQRFPDLPTTN